MKAIQALFVGYATLEEWLLVVERARPVYVALVTEPGKANQYDQHTDAMVIVAAQPDGDLVHYCRLVVGYVQYLGALPFNGQADLDAKLAQAGQAKAIVDAWLGENGLEIRPGVISTQANARFLDGWAGFLAFDNEAQAYCRK